MGKSEKRIIIVLGMHRSGTSAITRGLQVLGVELGDNLVPAMKDVNDKGFWEDRDLSTLNDGLLNILQNDWHHLAPITASDIETLRQKGFFDKASQLLHQKMEKAHIFGFKDPRVAKLMPFWMEIFDVCQLYPSCVLAIRHPLSVAKSLLKRDGFEVEKSYFLWLGHVIASLTGSSGLTRILVDYDELMSSPKNEISRIAGRLDLDIDPQELRHYEADFLDSALRHTVYDLNDLSADDACPPLVKEIYTALLDVASGHMDLDHPTLQLLVERWASEYRRLRPALVLADKLSKSAAINNQAILERDRSIADLSQANALQNRKIISLECELEAIYRSTSWQLTRPMRALKSAFTFSTRPKNRDG